LGKISGGTLSGAMVKDDDLLYHYTTAAGLIGLLGTDASSARMWMTQIQYMNDDSEFYHAYEFARSEIVKGELMTRYFAFSLTEKPDLLSQWRGYSPDGGYCIGFKFGDLKKLADSNIFSLRPCIYNDAEKKLMISKLVRTIELGIQNGEVDPSVKTNIKIPEKSRADATARLRIQEQINSLAPFLKHSGFQEECERRLAGIVGAQNDKRAKWRARGSSIVPYAELDISQAGPIPVVARKVIVGPGADYNLACHAIKFMRYDIYDQIEVTASTSTLRR
jgi:hypothetical protein